MTLASAGGFLGSRNYTATLMVERSALTSETANVDVHLMLRKAVIDGTAEDVITALSKGADPNSPDATAWTPLMWAAGAGAIEKVTLLLHAGADPFATTDDNRTAYLIAIVAGHRSVAQLLAEAEIAAGGDSELRSSRRHEAIPFCRAYRAAQLRLFPGWQEQPLMDDAPTAWCGERSDPIKEDDLLFVHRDLTVTRTVFNDSLVVFDGKVDGWADFCRDVLGFQPMTDFDWIQTT